MFYEILTKCSKNVFETKEINLKKNKTNYKIKNTLINNSENFIKHLNRLRSNTLNDNGLVQNFDKEKILPIINANEFLSENIDIVENTLKFLVMGASKSGKSYFISKVFEEKNKELKQYSGMLVIRKKNIKLLGNYIRLELLDTNSELSNSNMLDVYYKISDGMIMIIDNENVNSASYISELIEKMKYEFAQNEKYNLLFLSIIKNNDNLNNNNKQSFEIKNIISKIENEYNYHFKYIDLKDSEKFNNIINKFFSISYLKKGWNTKLNKGKEKKNFINNVKDIRKDIRHISLLKH
jgi:GTPase SAR1 family protein